MKRVFTFVIVVVWVITGLSVASIAVSTKDDPEQIVKAASKAMGAQPKDESLKLRWKTFLNKQNWGDGVHEGEVLEFPERHLIVSSASEFTRVGIGQPGWVESRIIAFERAELEAKTKIIRFWEETADTKRSLENMENAAWSDGSIEEAKKLNAVGQILRRIGKKSLALTEKTLDKALKKLDPEYDSEKYNNKTSEELKTIVEDKFRRRIRIMAYKTLIGVTTVFTTEGKVGGEYKILVGVVWSPKLNRLAMSLFNDTYNIPPVKPGKKLYQYLPNDKLVLLGTLGTRIVIDEKGHYAVLAFAQAQPRPASSQRMQSALQTAKQIASDRARAQIVNFIKEGLTIWDNEASRELSREFSDKTVGTENLRKYIHRINGRRIRVRLRGVHVLEEWSIKHPETGQPVAGVVIAWSPSSAALSEGMGRTMKTRPKTFPGANPSKNSVTKVPPIKSMDVDTSSY